MAKSRRIGFRWEVHQNIPKEKEISNKSRFPLLLFPYTQE
jgi:hypothetical protein